MKRRTRFVLSVLSVVSFVAPSLGACSVIEGIGGGPAACDWSLDRLAAQVVVVPADQANLAAATPAVTAGAGGVLLFGKAPSNLREQIANLVKQAPEGRVPLVMADQEGGSIQRLAGVVDKLNSARWMADHWSADQIQKAANTVGSQMKDLGVTMNLAPVLDLDDQATAPSKLNADGNRSFGIDPGRTTEAGLAFAKGLQAAGVTPVVKHFPGLGGTVGNTDYQPAQTLHWSRLQQAGLFPFKTAVDAGMPVVMTANASVPGLTDLPASISPEVMQVLRQQLGFRGVIMTDGLSAKALSGSGYTQESAAVAALKAGADFLLYGTPGTPVEEFNQMTGAIVAAVNQGQLSRDRLVQAANAVLALKQLGSCGS